MVTIFIFCANVTTNFGSEFQYFNFPSYRLMIMMMMMNLNLYSAKTIEESSINKENISFVSSISPRFSSSPFLGLLIIDILFFFFSSAIIILYA